MGAVKPRYSVSTYDWELRKYTPQIGLTVPSVGITLAELRQAMRELRRMGYECHRGDTSVYVERLEDQKQPAATE